MQPLLIGRSRLRQIRLDSTALAWVRYLEQNCALRVGLSSGREYEYTGVPLDVYQELLAAESKGRYYNANIRNDFPCRKI